jgi:hypothetical protein
MAETCDRLPCRYLIAALFLLPLAFGTTGCNRITPAKHFDQSLTWIPFEWEDRLAPDGSVEVEKVAMFVPLTLEGVPHQFRAQFDLGAGHSLLYGNPIAPYLEAYPAFRAKLDTSRINASVHGEIMTSFPALTFQVGPVTFNEHGLALLKDYGEEIDPDSMDAPTPWKVGTIGSSLFRDTTLIIDYPHQRLAMMGRLPDAIANRVAFVDMTLENGKIKVPISIDGKTYDVLFDTGSSMFPLLVPSPDWQRFRDSTASVDTLQISSWGTMIDVYGSPTRSGVYVGGVRLQGDRVYGIPHKGFRDFFKQLGILGLMGNDLFLDDQIIIDFPGRRFGVATDLFADSVGHHD